MRRWLYQTIFFWLMGFPFLGLPLAQATVSHVTAELSDPVVNANSGWEINFTLHTNLPSANIITVVFPENQKLPAFMNLQLNGFSVVAGGMGTTLQLSLSLAIPAGTIITMNIPPQAGLTNPSLPGNYTISAYTEVESTPVPSSPFTLDPSSDPVNIESVQVNPAVVGNPSDYIVVFNTGPEGYLWGGHSRIYLTFEPSVFISTGMTYDAAVNGQPAAALGQGQNLVLVSPLDIDNNTEVSVLVQSHPQMRHPLIARDYLLQVGTDAQPDPGEDTYFVGYSPQTLSPVSVQAEPNLAGNPAEYQIGFQLSPDGWLWNYQSWIFIEFPSAMEVPNGDIDGIMANSMPAKGKGDSTRREIRVGPVVDVAANTSIMITIPSAVGLINPPPGDYPVSVSTTVQPMGSSSVLCIVTPTVTMTLTATETPTVTSSLTPTLTVTDTPSVTDTVTMTDTPTITFTNTVTPTETVTTSVTPSETFTISPTRTRTSTITVSPTITASPTISGTFTLTATISATGFVQNLQTIIPYPQPARGNEMWFCYWNHGPAQVTIEIYNVLGEAVAKLSEARPETGYVRMVWNIEGMAGGIYIYRAVVVGPDGRRDFGIRKLIIAN